MELEVGPGAGGYRFRPFLKPSLNTVFLDIHPPREKPDAEWVAADAHLLPFRSGVFSRVVAVHVIEHLSNPQQFLRECYRVLKRGGRVLIAAPNFLSSNAYRDPDHRHVFSFLKLRKMLREAGFVTRHSYGDNIGDLIPRPIRKAIGWILALTCNDLVMVGIKP